MNFDQQANVCKTSLFFWGLLKLKQVITLNYKYKLKLNTEQTNQIEKILSVCKSVYNFAVAERKDWLKSRKSPVNSCSLVSEYIIPADALYPNYYHQTKQLTKAKEHFPRLKTVNAQVLQQVLKTVDKAFTDMKTILFWVS